ncbi:LysR family transcriptional regulator [Microbispora corallina]|uniref:LysR family transcriptional regulator n=1 Tax=Microbispora corallina TaxID=83302 RepID=A0ABQ4FV53_9ACTN|nr:LysR family transcriptional regulator [Microbispora corallina]GIH38692.1 LysR family transcriptional regulator [Microbispora corallina]
MEAGPAVRDVGCFAAVARHLSFSRAAAELGLSQPAVSQAVGRLERSLGLRLFDRTSRDVRLSRAGTELLPHAEALLAGAAAFSAEAARLAAGPRATVSLVYAPPAGPLVARVARRLARRSPAIDVALRPAGRGAAVAALASGEAAAAVLGAPFPQDLTTAARFHVPVGHLAVPEGDPLAATPLVRPEHLVRRTVLVPGNRPPAGMWARLAARLPYRHHVVADEIDDFAAVLDLVAAGIGLLPVPQLLVSSIRRNDVRFVPFDGGDLRLTYALAWPRDRMSGTVMALVQAVQESLWTR